MQRPKAGQDEVYQKQKNNNKKTSHMVMSLVTDQSTDASSKRDDVTEGALGMRRK